jgi:hypothetical protein
MKKLAFAFQLLACCNLIAAQPKHSKDSSNEKHAHNSCTGFERGDDFLPMNSTNCAASAAYSFPANVEVDSSWDLYTDVSYIYWYVGEDSMDLAVSGIRNGVIGFLPSGKNGFVAFQEFNYTSGFKVGLGANLTIDDWVADLEYTYLRQETRTSNTAPLSGLGGSYPGTFAFTNWFSQNQYGSAILAPAFTSKWNFGLDWIDLTFNRPFYQGTRLVVTPSAGLRASWIRQSLKINAPNAALGYDEPDPLPDTSINHSHSWGIGPRSVVDAHWIMGGGFRFQGNIGGSILFTQFTKVSHSELAVTGNDFPIAYSLTNYNCLRPMAEGNLGIGWGSYFCQNGYHFDLSATYDFNYLWGQNMMKYLVEVNGVPLSGTADAIFLHGLTAKARFDF